MKKRFKVTIQFKDPDFGQDLARAGVSETAIERLTDLAEFGEYWTIQLQFDSDGNIVSGKVV